MLNPEAFSSTDFVYSELPENARNAAFDCLSRRGFYPLEKYDIFSLNEKKNGESKYACFYSSGSSYT